MSIEEKPQLLEFNCTVDSMKDVSWNIKYDPTGEPSLHITGNGQNFHCPVELFGDVTAFLQSKNIIKHNVLTRGRTVETPGTEHATLAGPLLPPKVEGQNSISVVPVVSSGQPMDALASFDITNEASDLTPPKVENTVVNNTAIENSATLGPPPQVGGKVVTAKTKSEVITRPVIRTRVTGDDPQSAEKEAALLRGNGKAGSKKTIKKKHQIAE